MARPAKRGLDYYPMDVGFLRDKKVKLLRAEFGASSVLFVLYVFGKVFEGDGYFLRWDKDECLLAADELKETPAYISEVLQGCLSRSLFDQGVFQVFGVLTSAGIQRRYLRGCEKRDDITIVSEYWLLNVEDKNDVPSGIRAKLAFSEVSGGKNGVNSPGNSDHSTENPESKGKESKVKQRKVEDDGLSSVMTAYMDRINPTPSQTSMDELKNYVEQLGAAVCIRSIEIAQDERKTSWSYIRGILRNWTSKGVTCLADVEALDTAHRRTGKGAKTIQPGADTQPSSERIRKNADWMDKFLADQEAAHGQGQ